MGRQCFSVAATGTEPLIYQWQKDGLTLTDATATNYSRTNLTVADSGAYTVVVTNFLGSVTSSVAMLTVGYPPVVVEPPQSSTNLLCGTVVLSCTVTGTLPVNLQWLFNSASVANQTNSTLTLTSLQASDAGYYALSASNAFGGALSPIAQLSIFGTAGAATWTATGALNVGREYHTATFLPDGKVLVAGGYNGDYLSSAELFDPAAGTWMATGAMGTARYVHTATRLSNGEVLVAGGYGNSGYLSSAELFDPATGTWRATSNSLGTARYYHTATLLPNGLVLVAGGRITPDGNLSSAELYDPATGTWTPTGAMGTARYDHTATLLPSGLVLVAGGYGNNRYLSSAEVFDPATGTWTATGTLTTARGDHTATLLPGGEVLVAGGDGSSGTSLSSAEVFDPVTGTWTATGALTTVRATHTATLLPKGKVLVAGGYDNNGCLSSAELFDPDNGTWTATAALNTARYVHTATLLANGQVLVAGGEGTNGSLSSAELYGSSQPTAAVTLGNLSQSYDGTAKSVSVITIPPGLLVDLTYDGSANAPTNVGNYTVIGIINDACYQGSVTNTLVIYQTGITLGGATALTNGAFQFTFVNSPGTLFSVLVTTNMSLPLSDWTVLGAVTEVSPGQFQFTDPQATNSRQRFYRVRSP